MVCGCGKLALQDTQRVEQYATTVHDLGSMDEPVKGHHKRWTVGSLLKGMQEAVAKKSQESRLMVVIRTGSWAVPVLLVMANRLIRFYFVGNFCASRAHFGPLVAVAVTVSLLPLLMMWWWERKYHTVLLFFIAATQSSPSM